MPAISFKPRWTEKLRTGTKTHTIRELRKRPFHKGDHLFLYCEQRSKSGFKIGEVPCCKVEEIEFGLDPSGASLWMRIGMGAEFLQLASFQRIERLAIADGFQNLEDFIKFFFPKEKRPSIILPSFRGQVIHWNFDELELVAPSAESLLGGDHGSVLPRVQI